MSSTVASNMWSTDTLLCGVAHVADEADLAYLDEEEQKLQKEMEDPKPGCNMYQISSLYYMYQISSLYKSYSNRSFSGRWQANRSLLG